MKMIIVSLCTNNKFSFGIVWKEKKIKIRCNIIQSDTNNKIN